MSAIVRPGVDTLRFEDGVLDEAGAARDMSTASGSVCYLHAPDGQIYTEVGSWVTDGTNGLAEAFFTNKINVPGTWRFQFDFAGVSPGDPHPFEVGGNLPTVPAP